MTNLKVGGKTLELLHDGRLAHTSDWSEEVARSLAEKDGIELTHNHWDIIKLMREFYNQYNISPIRKLLIKAIKEKLGEKKASRDYLNSLFPGDVLVEGTKIAGLPIPMLDAEMDEETRHSEARKPAARKAVDPAKAKHFVNKFDLDGKVYKVTERGNLVDASQWSEKVAEHMAQKEGVKLTAEHWEVINYLRKFYFEFGVTPMVRLLMKYMKEQLGPEKSSEQYLYKLFPDGPSRQGSRIGGLPEPQGCID
jgi:tRNA 2-thiouridine synthesizing protein E